MVTLRRSIKIGKIIFLIVLIAVGLCFWWLTRSHPARWIVYYGNQLSLIDLNKIELAILEPENINVKEIYSPNDKKIKFIGYLSVGEAAEHQSYWYQVKGQPYLVEENKNWPGAWRVDIRSEEWQTLLLEKVIPEILNKGYDGLFLDTIDTAAHLELTYPDQFPGSRSALVNFVRKIHEKYPEVLIIPNNGLDLLEEYNGIIYGVVVEDLYTRYHFDSKTYTKTPIEETLAKEKILDKFLLTTEKPVFNILYDTSLKTDLARYAIKRSEKKRYSWYLTGVDLMQIGSIN
jgi:polysaccharide biosynthesis protein PelA